MSTCKEKKDKGLCLKCRIPQKKQVRFENGVGVAGRVKKTTAAATVNHSFFKSRNCRAMRLLPVINGIIPAAKKCEQHCTTPNTWHMKSKVKKATANPNNQQQSQRDAQRENHHQPGGQAAAKAPGTESPHGQTNRSGRKSRDNFGSYTGY